MKDTVLQKNIENIEWKAEQKLNDKYGGLFIDKKLINNSGINLHTINGLLCSKFNYFAKRFLHNLKKDIK